MRVWNVTRLTMVVVILALKLAVATSPSSAQSVDATIRGLLPGAPGDSAAAVAAAARAAGLPVMSLELLVRQGVAKEVAPPAVVAALRAEVDRLSRAQAVLVGERGQVNERELRAAADALHRGVTVDAIARLARLAPAGRSLELPIFVLAGLVDRGIPVDDALAAVRARMLEGTDDRELGDLPFHATRLFARGLAAHDVVRRLLLVDRRPVEGLLSGRPGTIVQHLTVARPQ